MTRFNLRLPRFDQERRTIMLFFTANALYFMANSACMPFLTAHYANLGIDSARIGLLASLGPISSILILPIWSRISDGTGNRRGVLKVITLGASAMVLLVMVSQNFWQLAVSVFLMVSFFFSVPPLSDAMVVSYLANTGYKFSSVRIGGTLGFLVFILLSGRIYDYNKSLSFIACSVFLLALFFCIRKVPQVEVAKREKKKADLKRLFANKKIIFILFMACMIQVVMSFYFSFIGVFIQELGYSSKEIAFSSFISACGEFPILLVIDKVLTRFSVTSVALFSGFMMVIRAFLMSGADNMGVILLCQAGHGLTFMTLYYSCVTFINNEMDDDLKSTGQSMLAFFQTGLGSILGNVLGGFMSGRVGVRSTFFVYGVFLGIVTAASAIVMITLKVRAHRKAAKDGTEQ